jgi:hypothetical protein
VLNLPDSLRESTLFNKEGAFGDMPEFSQLIVLIKILHLLYMSTNNKNTTLFIKEGRPAKLGGEI